MDGRIPEKIDSKFRYVLVSSRRAEQLIRGGRPHVEGLKKPTSTAMLEITDGMVEWDYGPDPEEVAAAEAAAAAAAAAAAEAEETEEVH